MKTTSKIAIKVVTRIPQQCNLASKINKNFKSEPEKAKL